MPSHQDLVKARHVREAATRWKHERYGSFQQSTRYDVWIDGEPFPPKAICALALDIATNGRIVLKPKDFPGLKDGDWHRHLKGLGFEVKDKPLVASWPFPTGGSPENDEWFDEAEKRSHPHDDAAESLAQDLQALAARAGKGTDVTRLIQARLGQGAFRKAVLRRWGHACAVTGITELALLRASHIKPWRESSDEERLSPDNGLPLTADLDALFDVGLISFDASGVLHWSSELEEATVDALNLSERGLREPPGEQVLPFLREHWAAFGYDNMEPRRRRTRARI